MTSNYGLTVANVIMTSTLSARHHWQQRRPLQARTHNTLQEGDQMDGQQVSVTFQIYPEMNVICCGCYKIDEREYTKHIHTYT